MNVSLILICPILSRIRGNSLTKKEEEEETILELGVRTHILHLFFNIAFELLAF